MSLFIMTRCYHPDYKVMDDIGLTVSLYCHDVVIADNLQDAMVSLVDRNLALFEGIMDISFVVGDELDCHHFLEDIPTRLRHCDRYCDRKDWLRDKWNNLSNEMRREYAEAFFDHKPGEVFGLYTLNQIPLSSIPDLRKRDE